MFLPRFSGNDDDNPTSWIFRAELYFTYLGFDEKHWLPLPSFYLDGEALAWFNRLFRNKLFLDWKHFKGKFAQQFQQQTNNDAVDHVFDKMPETYNTVDALALITGSNTAPETLEDRDSPHLGNAKSVEGENLVSTPLSNIEAKVFEEISHTTVSSEINDLNTIAHEGENFATTVAKVGDDSFNEDVSLQTKVPTTVLVDTKESNTEEEDNPRDYVVLFDKCPRRDTSDSLVPFPSQGAVMSNVSMRIDAIEYPFDGVLSHHTIPCLHNSLQDRCGGKQTRVSPYLDLSLHKRNWVDTGQKCNLPSFLSSNSRGCASEEIIQEVIPKIVARSSKQSPYTRVVSLLFGLVRKARLTSSYIVFDPGPYLDYVTIHAISSTFGGGNSVEEGIVVVLFERSGAKFPIGQALSVQIGITSDACNRFGTSVCCHMGTCTYFHLESDVIIWMVPFCSSVDNWFDTGQNDLGGASIANEPLHTAQNAHALLEAVAKRRTGYTTKLYDWGCVSGVEIDIQSFGVFNTSFATYMLLGEFTEKSLLCAYDGVTNILEQFNAPVVQSDMCTYTNCNILIFSLGHVTLLDWITRSQTGSLRSSPPAVKSEGAYSSEVISKKVIISLVGKLEYYYAAILEIPTLIQVTIFMASVVDIYTNREAMAHVKAIFYDSPTRNLISSILQYSGNFSNIREPVILVCYLKSIWSLLLRGLSNSKNPYVLKPLLQPLPHASILRRHFLRVAHNYKVLYNWWIHLGLNVYKLHDAPKPYIFRLQKIHITGHRALQWNIYIIFLELLRKELLQHKEMGNSWIHGSVCWTGLSLWLDIHHSFSFCEPNLEDKVLIESGSIVVNRVGSVRAYRLELVNETDLIGIIGPSKMLEHFIWDPGPIINWLNRSWS